MRLIALMTGDMSSPTKHKVGLPGGLKNGQQELPSPSLLVIEEDNEGVFIYRYNAHGEFAGDTWHDTLAKAQDQVTFEFPTARLEWVTVPDHVEDAVSFAMSHGNKPSWFPP